MIKDEEAVFTVTGMNTEGELFAYFEDDAGNRLWPLLHGSLGFEDSGRDKDGDAFGVVFPVVTMRVTREMSMDDKLAESRTDRLVQAMVHCVDKRRPPLFRLPGQEGRSWLTDIGRDGKPSWSLIPEIG